MYIFCVLLLSSVIIISLFLCEINSTAQSTGSCDASPCTQHRKHYSEGDRAHLIWK